MNPFTLYRQHPLEMLLFHLRGTLVFGIVTGFFYYRFSSALTLFEILGVNIGRFIFLFLGANLRHSHIPLRYGNFLEHIFISPLQHQIHHSKDKNDHHKNMGSHLAIWDWMFGTLKISNADTKVIEFGLPEQGYEINNWWNALWSPLVNAFKSRKN
jgi:sterol desaturase/sphingolipid hydroxylase (fatty acid hydroxylase superfamily)